MTITYNKNRGLPRAASAFPRRRSVMLALPLLAALSFPAFAQSWKINLRDADLNAFISEVAQITGKNFAVDPRVKGTVTVISNKPLNQREVYDLLMGVLSVNGVVAIPDGNVIKLVPDVNVRQNSVPFDMKRKSSGSSVVTRVMWLDNVNPADLIPAIRPLMPQYAHLSAVQGTNALIISDKSDNIDNIESLVRSIDRGDKDKFDYVTLQYTQAEEILETLKLMTGYATGDTAKDSGRVKVIADARTNRLIIRGDSKTRSKLKNLISELDVEPSNKLGGIRVFPLQHASAKTVAVMLQALMTNTSIVTNSPSSTLSGNSSLGSSSSGNSGNSSSSGNNNNNGQPTSLNNMGGNSGGNSSGNSSSSNNGVIKNHEPVSIIADESQNAVIVKANSVLMAEIAQTIKQLDMRRTQVLIEAAIVEVTGGNLDQLGIQWALGNPSGGVGLINFTNVGSSLASLYGAYATAGAGAAAASTAAGALSSLSGGLFGLGDSRKNSDGTRNFYGAVIQALANDSHANLLSVPSVITLDNEEANILVGQNVPFVTGSTLTTGAGTSSPFTTIERKDVGVSLKVIPHVGDSGTVRLEVMQEVSNIAPATASIKSADIITNKRSVKTTVLADNEQTIVLGGLMQDDATHNGSRVPGVSNVPVLGNLFRSNSQDRTKRNLLIFLKPTILRESNAMTGVTNRGYARIQEMELQLDPSGQFKRLPATYDEVYIKGSATYIPANPPGTIDMTQAARGIQPQQAPLPSGAVTPVSVPVVKKRFGLVSRKVVSPAPVTSAPPVTVSGGVFNLSRRPAAAPELPWGKVVNLQKQQAVTPVASVPQPAPSLPAGYFDK